MATDAEVRAVLREHGVTVPPRGRLGQKYHVQYAELTYHDGAAAADPDADPWDGPDDDGDVITATIPDAVPAPADVEEPAAAAGAEQRPRRPGRSKDGKRGGGFGARLFGTSSGKPKQAKRPAHARLPTDRMISRVWGGMARMTARLSTPVSNTFQLQGPVAGMLLDDAVRGTFLDPVLQYAARGEKAGETVIALGGPPLLVLAIERAQGLEEPHRSIQLAVLVPMLEEALGMWVTIAGDKMEEAARRAEENAATQAEVQRYLALIFPQAEVVNDEEAAAADMAGAAM
jgi:hypothetical protein